MGDQANVVTFAVDDCFLRRVSKKRLIKDGIVAAEAFDDKHPTLSFTLQREYLKTEEGLDEYQRDKVLPSGDLPGLATLSFHDLTESVNPPLRPWREPDPEDEKYGHLHCCTKRAVNEAHREQLAKISTRNGVLRPFIRRRDRGTEPSHRPSR